jgi:signal peptidase I
MAQWGARIEREEYAYEDEQGEHRGSRLLREVLETAVLTLLLFLVVRLAVQNFKVDGPSMMPTLQNQQLIVVDKAEYYLHPPQRGDIIVFAYPLDPSQDFVKRVVGVPGDTVELDQTGYVYVDGVRLNEPYIEEHYSGLPQNKSWRLGPTQYFVMGDHRDDSSDSRFWGPVPRQNIVGKAVLVYWPYNNLHFLQDWSGVFAGIHTTGTTNAPGH